MRPPPFPLPCSPLPGPPRAGFWPFPGTVGPAPVLQLPPVPSCSRPPGHTRAGSSELVGPGAVARSLHHPDPGHPTLTCFFISWDALGDWCHFLTMALASCKVHDTQVLMLPSHVPPTARPWWMDALPEPPGTYAIPTSSRLSAQSNPTSGTHSYSCGSLGHGHRHERVRGGPSASQGALSTHCHPAISTAPLT